MCRISSGYDSYFGFSLATLARQLGSNKFLCCLRFPTCVFCYAPLLDNPFPLSLFILNSSHCSLTFLISPVVVLFPLSVLYPFYTLSYRNPTPLPLFPLVLNIPTFSAIAPHLYRPLPSFYPSFCPCCPFVNILLHSSLSSSSLLYYGQPSSLVMHPLVPLSFHASLHSLFSLHIAPPSSPFVLSVLSSPISRPLYVLVVHHLYCLSLSVLFAPTLPSSLLLAIPESA